MLSNFGEPRWSTRRGSLAALSSWSSIPVLPFVHALASQSQSSRTDFFESAVSTRISGSEAATPAVIDAVAFGAKSQIIRASRPFFSMRVGGFWWCLSSSAPNPSSAVPESSGNTMLPWLACRAAPQPVV